MTIVARFLVHNYPVLLGDILLSGKQSGNPKGQAPHIPTVGNTSSIHHPGSKAVIAGVNQKIILIDDALVVGWAGGRSIARTIIKELREQHSKEPFTFDNIPTFFKSCEAEVKAQKVGFAGYLREPSGTIAFFNYVYNIKDVGFTSDLFGEVRLMGTGAEAIRQLLEGVCEIPLPILSGGIKANALEIAIPFSFYLSGMLLESEIRTRESLSHYYGGGYELATLEGGKFVKLDDVIYMFWYADIDGKHVTFEPHQALKQKYYEDLLALRSLTFKDKHAGPWSFDDSTHLISPIYRDVTKEEKANFVPPDMNSTTICNYFLIRNPNQGGNVFPELVFTKVDYIHDGGLPPVIFTDAKGAMGFSFNKIFLQDVATSIQRFLRSST